MNDKVNLILWLRANAEKNGYLPTRKDWIEISIAEDIINSIKTGYGNSIGLDIREGNFRTKEAKQILRRALYLLKDIDTLVAYIKDFGYTENNLKYILYHYNEYEMKEHRVKIDYILATSEPTRVHKIIYCLISQKTKREIERELKTNYNRAVKEAMTWLLLGLAKS